MAIYNRLQQKALDDMTKAAQKQSIDLFQKQIDEWQPVLKKMIKSICLETMKENGLIK